MTTLHMDIGVSRVVVNQMNQTCDELHSQLVVLNNCIQPFVGSSWISPAATNFSSEFTHWTQRQRLMVEELQTLAQKLEIEIAQWEEAAANF